jgi:GxxExxY protein
MFTNELSQICTKPMITKQAEDFLFKEECYQIIGAAMEVHTVLGAGFLEAVYQEALGIEFTNSRIPYEKEALLDVKYKGILLDKRYIADFICFDEIIVELKTTEIIIPDHVAQVLNYLKATNTKLGLILNFGASKLQYKRVIL